MTQRTIHPPESTKFLTPDRPFQKWKKVELDEHTPYAVFAWEFLRRNRFYQALVDKKKNALPIEAWGYRWNEHVPHTHGLVNVKPYWEAYDEGAPPMWQGLDDFLTQLPTQVDLTEREFTTKLKPGQIAIVFDTGGMYLEKSPWEVQIGALTDRLVKLSPAFKYKVMHQSVLLRRWCLLKLMSDEDKTLASAAQDRSYTAKYRSREEKEKGRAGPNMGGPFGGLIIRPVPRTTINEDASALYDLVYGHGYLHLLSGETSFETQGDKLTPYSIVLAKEIGGN